MYLIIFYLSIALLELATTGMLHVVAKKRFDLKRSTPIALLWPFYLPLTVYKAYKETNK